MRGFRLWAMRFLVAAVISVVSVVGTLAWQWVGRLDARSPLAAGLRGKWADMSSEFNQRIQTRFPLGSSAVEMARELVSQGFQQQDWVAAEGSGHVATRREDGLVCRKAAYVFWQTSLEGLLTEIRGQYREEGCS